MNKLLEPPWKCPHSLLVFYVKYRMAEGQTTARKKLLNYLVDFAGESKEYAESIMAQAEQRLMTMNEDALAIFAGPDLAHNTNFLTLVEERRNKK